MSDRISLSGYTLNAPDALALARFYADITGGTAEGSEEWAAAVGPHGVLSFQQDPDFRAPSWPSGGEVPMLAHVEFVVDDLPATEGRVVAAGATRFEHQPNAHCLVFADPAGHPFCLSTWEGPQHVGPGEGSGERAKAE